jgi:hypothetical protein
MAVRTRHCLQVITMRSIPFSKRAVWLTKVLASIVGIGGIFGAIIQIGVPWFIGILPAGVALFFALKEDVEAVVPPKPSHDAAVHQSSWQEYWRLRRDYVRSLRWFVASSLILILSAGFGDYVPRTVRTGLLAFGMVAVFASIGFMTVKELKWLRWPCPRCGCAFRGFWNRPWLPKSCVYCGLPRDTAPTSARYR